MPYNTKDLAKTSGIPVPQYFNTTADVYEPVLGSNGALYIKPMGGSALKGALLNITTAGTRVQLPTYACTEITIIAKRQNTGTIFVGGSDVSATVYGAELLKEGSITLTVSNADMVWIDAQVSGEGVSYFAIRN
jgi:hypothetical protein